MVGGMSLCHMLKDLSARSAASWAGLAAGQWHPVAWRPPGSTAYTSAWPGRKPPGRPGPCTGRPPSKVGYPSWQPSGLTITAAAHGVTGSPQGRPRPWQWLPQSMCDVSRLRVLSNIRRLRVQPDVGRLRVQSALLVEVTRKVSRQERAFS